MRRREDVAERVAQDWAEDGRAWADRTPRERGEAVLRSLVWLSKKETADALKVSAKQVSAELDNAVRSGLAKELRLWDTIPTEDRYDAVRVLIDGTPVSHTIKALNHGECSVREGGRETREEMEGEVLTGEVYVGDESGCEVSISMRCGSAIFDTDEVYELLKAPTVNGKKVPYNLEFDLLDSQGATTGKKMTLTKVYDPPRAFEHRFAGGGADADTHHGEAPTTSTTGPRACTTRWRRPASGRTTSRSASTPSNSARRPSPASS